MLYILPSIEDTKLKKLDISGNNLSDRSLATISAHCTYLECLSLEGLCANNSCELMWQQAVLVLARKQYENWQTAPHI